MQYYIYEIYICKIYINYIWFYLDFSCIAYLCQMSELAYNSRAGICKQLYRQPLARKVTQD